MRASASILATALLLLPLAAPAGGGEAVGTGAPVDDRAEAAPVLPDVDAAVGVAGAAGFVGEAAASETPVEPPQGGSIPVPAGAYAALYGSGEAARDIEAFALDRRPVTRAEYAAFVAEHPQWRRDRVKRIFADAGYLASWAAPDDPGSALDGTRPATEVSWFGALAYCQAQGQRLPTVDEWEYAATTAPAGVGTEEWKTTVLSAANRRVRGAPGPVGSGLTGAWGLRDLHGLVQEWTLDFNTMVVSNDSRGSGARDRGLYCASSARGATDVSDYAAFLRYAFRASMDGRGTTANLGFRCAGG